MNTTSEEREILRAEHLRRPPPYQRYCGWCAKPWPCPTVRLLGDIEDLQLRLDAVHTIKGVSNGADQGLVRRGGDPLDEIAPGAYPALLYSAQGPGAAGRRRLKVQGEP